MVTGLGSRLGLFGTDFSTFLPKQLDAKDLFSGNYCNVATDPYGEFVYVPKSDNMANILFGLRTVAGGSSLEPLPLSTGSPTNTFRLTAQQPSSMTIRYSRRDREVLIVPE